MVILGRFMIYSYIESDYSVCVFVGEGGRRVAGNSSSNHLSCLFFKSCVPSPKALLYLCPIALFHHIFLIYFCDWDFLSQCMFFWCSSVSSFPLHACVYWLVLGAGFQTRVVRRSQKEPCPFMLISMPCPFMYIRSAHAIFPLFLFCLLTWLLSLPHCPPLCVLAT